MDTLPQPDHIEAPALESPEELRERLAWEAACLEQARVSIEAGNVVEWERVEAWMDSLDTDHPLPRPRPLK